MTKRNWRRRVAHGARPGLAAIGARSWLGKAAVVGCALVVAACGGRATEEVAVDRPLDARLSCVHIDAERRANLDRIADLRDEREANRLRSVARAPGAVLGNPLSAIALADPSVAIYREIAGLERRNLRLDELAAERDCDAGESAPQPEMDDMAAETADAGAAESIDPM